jgi:putative Holliday junction resolvase
MRKLSIDYGEVRTGIAITDALGVTAQGLKTIINNGNDKILLDELDKILSEYEIDTIIVGMPKNMNGTNRAKGRENKYVHS